MAYNKAAFIAWARANLEPNPFYIQGGGTLVGVPPSCNNRKDWNHPHDPQPNEGRPGMVWYMKRSAVLCRRTYF